MVWQYRTILFEFTKDGLLGDRYVDDEEMEKTLNQMGQDSWELVDVSLLQDGLLAFLKRPVGNEALATAARLQENLDDQVEQRRGNSQVVREIPALVDESSRVPPNRPPISGRNQPDNDVIFVEEPVPRSRSERPRHSRQEHDDSDIVGGIRIS